MTSAFTTAVLISFFTPFHPPMPLPPVVPHRLEAPDIITISISGLPKKATLWAQPSGEYLVSNNGEVYLGPYGSARVEGLTVAEAEQAIAQKIKPHLPKKQAARLVVKVELKDTNKAYYRIDRRGSSDVVQRIPLGNSVCVLDALADQVKNPTLKAVLARAHDGKEQILPIDWYGLTQRGLTGTNYQLLPGDRLYVYVPVSLQ